MIDRGGAISSQETTIPKDRKSQPLQLGNIYQGGLGLSRAVGRRRRASAIYWVYYGVTVLIFTAFIREYMRVEELGMILTNCAVEKHSINSQMDILYEQRMSLKTLIEREREIHQKIKQDWEQDKGATVQRLSKCEADSKKTAKKLVEATGKLGAQKVAWAKEKKVLRESLSTKFGAEMKAKLGPMAQSLAKYRADADTLKGKVRACGARNGVLASKIAAISYATTTAKSEINEPVTTNPPPKDDFI